MIRFRNPGTQYSTQILVIKHLYASLSSQDFFTLEDMAVVIAKKGLMTAYGYAGDEALRLSNADQDSLNSAKMNAKMYAEVYRMLGWVTPYKADSSYPLVFTIIGIHIAQSKGSCLKLYEQCVLGINTPTQLTSRVSFDEKVRFFKCALKSFIDLDGVMYKHELCIGPMSVNDENEDEYMNMILKVKSMRGSYSRLRTEFSSLAKSLDMKTTPVDNCTRLPIAFMKNCNWIVSVSNSSLYGRKLSCLAITQHGIDTYETIKDMFDLRLDQFERLEEHVQYALIRLGTYSMLDRSNYDMSSVQKTVETDLHLCKDILQGREILFSPCQTLRREIVEHALSIARNKGATSTRGFNQYAISIKKPSIPTIYHELSLNTPTIPATHLLSAASDHELLSAVLKHQKQGYTDSEIVERLFEDYRASTQAVFYPVVVSIFKAMGFVCTLSRPGDNGARWDAIIIEDERSIPIEIKSPMEEQNLSIKAIRQALENKIVLLSRKTYKTKPNVSSLVVGYLMPNDRAEVESMIHAFKATYGYSIGVIDFRSLLSIFVSILVNNRGFDKEMLFSAEGLIHATV